MSKRTHASKKNTSEPPPPDSSASDSEVVSASNNHLAHLVDRRRLLCNGAALGIGSISLKGMSLTGLTGLLSFSASDAAAAPNPSSLTFKQPAHVIGDDHGVAPGHNVQVLIGFGDPVLPGAPEHDPADLTPGAMGRQFGANNDFTAFLPLASGPAGNRHGLLCVNHEYTNRELMWPDAARRKPFDLSRDQMAVEIAAHGHSVIEIKQSACGTWAIVEGSRFARRLTGATPIAISGPAAGHKRLQTPDDPTGKRVLGTLYNCAGGKTPWGTILIAEENFQGYFTGGKLTGREARNHESLGVGTRPWYGWGKYFDRFDVTKQPTEANRFGWMVELDPYDPARSPVKRSALGRFKHEGAGVARASDGRAVVYSGDDEKFQYLYRFVSRDPINDVDRRANWGLLDHGTLYVARFDQNNQGAWLPLIWNDGPLTPANGFETPADVLIETRIAAKMVGATPLDRPEDVEVHPTSSQVYMMLTNNRDRSAAQEDAANPRGPNPFGHIIEITPSPGPKGAPDHGAMDFTWEILLKAGDPSNIEHEAQYHADTQAHGTWLAAPDNAAIDPQGRLWISTDQGSRQKKNKIPDGMYASDLTGPGRALPRLFFACPRDAEMCGPEFTPDGRTLFAAVQHPGEGSSYTTPSTRWPDFDPGRPPRAAIVAITRRDGGIIGR